MKFGTLVFFFSQPQMYSVYCKNKGIGLAVPIHLEGTVCLEYLWPSPSFLAEAIRFFGTCEFIVPFMGVGSIQNVGWENVTGVWGSSPYMLSKHDQDTSHCKIASKFCISLP